MKTKWHPYPGYEGIYEAHIDGGVKSVDRQILVRTKTGYHQRFIKGTVLKPYVHKGYLQYSLWRDGKRKLIEGHTIICTTFHGPKPFDTAQVRHLKGRPDDNRAKNLAWGTSLEDADDKRRHGTMNTGSRNGVSKLTEDQVLEIRRRWPSESAASLARQFGISGSSAENIVNRKSWRHIP